MLRLWIEGVLFIVIEPDPSTPLADILMGLHPVFAEIDALRCEESVLREDVETLTKPFLKAPLIDNVKPEVEVKLCAGPHCIRLGGGCKFE